MRIAGGQFERPPAPSVVRDLLFGGSMRPRMPRGQMQQIHVEMYMEDITLGMDGAALRCGCHLLPLGT
jgi:hypothetical protein